MRCVKTIHTVILWLVLLVVSLVVLPAYAAENKEIIKEASWDIGGGESYEGARTRAKAKAEREAAEEAGVYIESYSKVNHFQLTADEVQLIAAAILQVEVLDEEQRKTGKTSTAAWIKIKATVASAAVDDLRAKLKNKNTDRELRQALAETDKLKKLLEEQNKQLVALRKQLSQPQNEAARQQLLVAVADNERTAQALDALREARRHLLFLAYSEADKALERALTAKPDMAQAYLAKGDSYLGRQDYSQAAAAYRQATRYASTLKQAWFGLATALAFQDSYAEAAQAFSYSAEYNPEAMSAEPAKLKPYQQNGRWGFRRADGTVATAPIYDRVEDFYEGLARVYFGNHVGYVTETKEAALLLSVDRRCNPWVFSSGRARITLGKRHGYIDKSGQMTIEPIFEEAFAFQAEGASVQIGEKWGVIDHAGRVIIKPQSDQPFNFNEGLSVINQNFKFGYMDSKGKLVIPVQFDFAWQFSEGLAVVTMGNKTGYIDKTGQYVIPLRYAGAESFKDGKAQVSLTSGFGYIDQTGKFVIEPIYYMAHRFNDGIALVQKDPKVKPVWINRKGEEVAWREARAQPAAAQKVLDPFSVNGMYGYKDDQNQVVIPAQFEKAYHFHEGLAAVQLQNKWGFIDTDGRMVIQPQYYNANKFSEGLAAVATGIDFDQFIYIDKTGKQAFPGTFDWASDFNEGRAEVGRNNKNGVGRKYGYIDRSGQLVIPYQFSMTNGGFSDGLAAVFVADEFWINKRGEIIQQKK